MTTRRTMTPYASGYEHGARTAVKFVETLRSRTANGTAVPPNDLAHVLTILIKKIDALGGWAMAERPVAEHSVEQQAILGEFYGFCAGLMEAL